MAYGRAREAAYNATVPVLACGGAFGAQPFDGCPAAPVRTRSPLRKNIEVCITCKLTHRLEKKKKKNEMSITYKFTQRPGVFDVELRTRPGFENVEKIDGKHPSHRVGNFRMFFK